MRIFLRKACCWHGVGKGHEERWSQDSVTIIWLPPRDSNPDRLLQRQLSYH